MIPSSTELVDDPANFNVLLMGKHGSNVDTIIFANINTNTRKITLLSVPRDLWVDGRKINSYYGSFGLYQQVKTVESILGYKIHKYILIDMYVFRDVIDLMGGVTVTLESDLVDPTYKTCDNGICSTLYYEAGEHHLDGTEALRVARSRHTTSDYSRASRQQLILEGIQEKAKSLGFGDAEALVDIIQTVLASTETDIAADEALRYYFRYQNFELSRGSVLSPANVLSSVAEPVNYVTSHEITFCLDEAKPETCSAGYALDTLQPRDGNWDLIPWYVGSLL